MKECITPTTAAAPIGPYSPIVRASGEFLFFSGQIALGSDGRLIGTTVAEQTEQICRNIGEMLKEVGATFADVVKTTVYLRSMDSFAEMNAVYERYFGGSMPARTTVAVSGLPKDALIEIELIVAR